MDNLKRQRGSIKGKFTRLERFVEADNNPAEQPKTDITNRLTYLEATWIEYQECHRLIVEAVDEDEVEEEEAEIEEAEGRYFTIKSKLQTILKDDDDGSSSAASQPSVQANGPHQSISVADIKLPRLDLPKFSGDVLQWTSFHDLFTSMVHNQVISNSQKLQYLKISLTGEAATLIQSFDVTDANYVEAWSILKTRYQNERFLIQSHLQSLFSQQQLREESSPRLRNLIDHTNKCVRALQLMGLPTDDWDSFLVFIVTDRMDSDSRRQWELHHQGSSYPSYAVLQSFVEQRCRALDSTASARSKGQTRPHTPKNTVSSHLSLSDISCVVCQENHPLHQCPKFGSMDSKERQAVVRVGNLCFNCLRPNHSLRNCQSKSTCRKCGLKHHSLLHIEKLSSSVDDAD